MPRAGEVRSIAIEWVQALDGAERVRGNSSSPEICSARAIRENGRRADIISPCSIAIELATAA